MRRADPGSDALAVTLLGTGMPQPDRDRRGPSQVVELGVDLVLVDCGPGALHRFLETGFNGASIRLIALTHLHADHVTGLADILWAGWVGGWWKTPPLLIGPPGTRTFVTRLLHAFEDDIRWRSAEGATTRGGLQPDTKEVEDGWSFDKAEWRLTAFRVDHHPVEHAFGFRFEAAGRAIVLSGDTRRCENLIERAEDADLLVHEVIWGEGMRRAISQASTPQSRARLDRILSYHTPATDVGEVAALANVTQLVLTHLIFAGGTPDDLIADVRESFQGLLCVGEDLARFPVG